jgi:hypothetical protein
MSWALAFVRIVRVCAAAMFWFYCCVSDASDDEDKFQRSLLLDEVLSIVDGRIRFADSNQDTRNSCCPQSLRRAHTTAFTNRHVRFRS